MLSAVLFGIKPLVFAKNPCDSDKNSDDCYAYLQAQYDSTSKQLNDIRTQKDSISKKLSDYASQLTVTQSQINDLEAQISKTETDLAAINQSLQETKGSLQGKIDLRDTVLRNYAMHHQLNDLETFLAYKTGVNLTGFQFSALSQEFSKAVTEQTVKIIGGLNSEINSYESDKAEGEKLKGELEDNQQKFLAMKNDLANKKTSAQTQLTNVTQTETTLETKLAELSAQQQSILSAKNGEGTGSVGDFESPKVTTPNPPSGFGTAFAAFSYGAYTHYNGMSQYGAKGRADSGQKYDKILKFYYKVGTTKQKGLDSSKISVQGAGTMTYRDYLYGLAEMPATWPIEALKAQAVAGRTYASKAGKPICTSQSCQVFSKSKSDGVKNGQYPLWKKAVDDTADEVLDNSSTSQYSSTTGGYINNIGWDTSGNWPGDAYEKKAASPWFYKAWYIKSYADTSNCGRNHPWLTEKEMADILNSWVVWNKGSSSDKGRISPVTTSCWGGNPYSLTDMADKADKYGDKYTSISSVDVTVGNNGITSKVTFQTNNGSVSIDGDTFKSVFNLRAPGYLSIKSRLFDIEKK